MNLGRGATRTLATVALGTVLTFVGGAAVARPALAGGLMDAGLAARLDAKLREFRSDYSLAGVSAAILLPDGSSWEKAIGPGEIGPSGWNVTTETPFVIGSITKTFVATIVMQLAEEGVLSLTDTLSRWMPGYRNSARITVRQLLSHRAGLADYFMSPRYEHLVFGRPTHTWTVREILQLVGRPLWEPGAGYFYSNTDYILLGVIIERATGESLGDLIRNRFLTPLGLDHTYFQGEEPVPVTAAYGYLRYGHTWEGFSDGTTFRPNTSGATVAWAAGAMMSTPHDLVTWARALYGGHILQPASLAQMVTFDKNHYGLGTHEYLLGGRFMWGHGGSIRGFQATMFYVPSLDLAVVTTSNRGRVSVNPLAERLLKIVFDRLWPDSTAPTVTAPSVALLGGVRAGRGTAPVRVSWHARDSESGIDHFELQRSVDGGPWTGVQLADAWLRVTDTQVPLGHQVAFQVRAVDARHNVSEWAVGPTVRVTALTGEVAPVTHDTRWWVATDPLALGGHELRARARGAEVSVTLTTAGFAWIGSMGPRRGRADLLVDGSVVRAVDLHARAKQMRQVLDVRGWSANEQHTVTIRARGTPRRPVVSLDEILLLELVGP